MTKTTFKISALKIVVVISILGFVLPNLLPIQTFFAPIAYAASPNIFSYQGRLTDSTGALLGGSGTNYYFKFSIWDSATVGAGTRLWPSGAPGTMTTSVVQGVFNVNIGDTANGYPDALNYDFNTSSTIYLQVEASSDNSTFETLSPRQQITSSGYAINANTLQGKTPGTSANNVLTLNGSGAINIAGGITTSSTLQGGSALTSGTAALINTTNTFSGNLMDLQVNGSSKFSVDQAGNVSTAGNISGSAALILSSGGTGALTIKTLNQSAGSTNSANVSIVSGNAAGVTSNSGNISIDVGTATQTAGTISIGPTNATSVVIGRSGQTTQIKSGTPATNGVAYSSDANGTITFTATGGAGTLCLLSVAGGVPAWGACGGVARLDQISAATAANSINNGDNAQTWNWALGTATKSAMKITENTAATLGVGNQYLLEVGTIASSTAAPLTIKALGNKIIDTTSAGAVTLSPNAGLGVTISPTAGTSGSPTALTITGPAHTTLTASTEASDVNFNLARTVQFATGALTTQRAALIQAPSYGFVAASTLTDAATLDITGGPKSQTNATITNSHALRIEAGAVQPAGAVTNSYGLTVNAQTGATNNYAAAFLGGAVGIGTAAPVKAGNGLTIAPSASTTGSPTLLTITGPAHTTLTASTEATDINFNLARTVQFATGALTNQRALRIQAPTYGFVAASTITNAATLDISGAPIAGTNATITNPAALIVESGNVGIGLQAPLAILHVKGGSTFTAIFEDALGSQLSIGPSAIQTLTANSWALGVNNSFNLADLSTWGRVQLGYSASTVNISSVDMRAKPSFSLLTATVSKTASSATLTGAGGSQFTQELAVGDRITVPGGASETRTITAIASDTSLTVDSTFANTASAQTATVFPSISRFDTGAGTPKLIVSDLGNVGIGTVTPVVGGGLTIAPVARTSGSPSLLTVTGPADTTLTASTEASDVNFNLARTVQFATGALTTQRAVRIQAPTYSFAGASTITNAATLDISGQPIAGTNATITTPASLWIESGRLLLGTGTPLTVTGTSATIDVLSMTGDSVNITYNSASSLTIGNGLSNLATFDNVGSFTLSPSNASGGSVANFTITPADQTNLTASTEVPDINYVTHTVQHATGALSIQRAVKLAAPTYSFAGASTLTDAATLGITGGPISGTNATLTNTHALLISSGAVSTATNSYGLTVNAQTGATNNYAAAFLGGAVGIGTAAPVKAGNGLTIAPSASTTGSPTLLTVTGPAHTTLTASTEATDINFNLARTVQFATGALTTQRAALIQAPTYGFVAASTLTDAATLGITGGPISGTNATLTNTHALLISSGAVSTATNSYGLTVNAQTGATNNYAAAFLGGAVGIGTAAPVKAGNGLTIAPSASTTGSPTLLTVTGPAHTTLTASTEATDINFNLARTVQFATGALTTQRATLIQAPTYGFVAASTITAAATISVTGAPVAGTNATITNKAAILTEAGDVVIKNGSLCVGNVAMGTWSGAGSCSGARTNGQLYATSTTIGASDYAEQYLSTNVSMTPGMLISLDPNKKSYVTQASYTIPDASVMGIVSTNPGVLIGYGDTYDVPANAKAYPVALAGRVPVLITEENGPIQIGDHLTLSKTLPGYAMKQTKPGESVGIALESSQSGVDKILVFVNLGFHDPGMIVDSLGNVSLQRAGTTSFEATSSTAAALINQKGSGNLLQVQSVGVEKLLVKNTGELNINVTPADNKSNLVVVKSKDSEVLTINAQGQIAVTGNIIIKDDTFAGSIATDSTGTAQIDFTYDLGTGKPDVQLTVEGETPAFAQVATWKKDIQNNYTGFTIKSFAPTGGPASVIVHYLVVGKQAGYQTSGTVMQVVTAPTPTPPPSAPASPTPTLPPATDTAPASAPPVPTTTTPVVSPSPASTKPVNTVTPPSTTSKALATTPSPNPTSTPVPTPTPAPTPQPPPVTNPNPPTPPTPTPPPPTPAAAAKTPISSTAPTTPAAPSTPVPTPTPAPTPQPPPVTNPNPPTPPTPTPPQ